MTRTTGLNRESRRRVPDSIDALDHGAEKDPRSLLSGENLCRPHPSRARPTAWWMPLKTNLAAADNSLAGAISPVLSQSALQVPGFLTNRLYILSIARSQR